MDMAGGQGIEPCCPALETRLLPEVHPECLSKESNLRGFRARFTAATRSIRG